MLEMIAYKRYSGVQKAIIGKSVDDWNTLQKLTDFLLLAALPSATACIPLCCSESTWFVITATTGSMTRQTLPGEGSANNWKHADLPEPVGWTIIAPLPACSASTHWIWNCLSSVIFSWAFAFFISQFWVSTDDDNCKLTEAEESEVSVHLVHY